MQRFRRVRRDKLLTAKNAKNAKNAKDSKQRLSNDISFALGILSVEPGAVSG